MEKEMKIIMKRCKKLNKLVLKIIDNLGEEDIEMSLNTIGVIKTISEKSLIKIKKIQLEKIRRKKLGRRIKL